MLPPTEPKVEEFFASADGVCVYVGVAGRAVRVQFTSPDGPGAVLGARDTSTDEALAVATRALNRHQPQIQALFDRIAVELAARRG